MATPTTANIPTQYVSVFVPVSLLPQLQQIMTAGTQPNPPAAHPQAQVHPLNSQSPQPAPYISPENPSNGPSGSEEERPRQVRRSWDQKLAETLELWKQFNWNLGDFMHYTFRLRDEDGKEIRRTPQHRQMVSKYLAGITKHKVSEVLDAWLHSSDGLPSLDHQERIKMYRLEPDFKEICYARPCLTSFAAQMVEKVMGDERRNAVKKTSGLHGFTTGGRDISEQEYGADTINNTTEILKKFQPLTFQYLVRLSTPKRSSVTVGKVRRPPEMVVTHALSSINYSYNEYAKRLALDKGILYFACNANKYLYSFNSRVASTPSQTTLYNALSQLADHDLALVKAIATSPNSAVFFRPDNVQKYVRPRDQRIGREAWMKHGTHATACVIEDYNPAGLDLALKKALIQKNERRDLKFDRLWSFMDQTHINEMLVIQWLRVLVLIVPELKVYQSEVVELYRTKDSKKQLPLRKTRVFPLRSNGFKEIQVAGLQKATLDFLNQLGQTEDSYTPRLIFIGGDGLTYENLVLTKNYMQFHDTPFQKFELVRPVLESWHTCWTDLSRIFEAHWDSYTSKDPSSLGGCANLIRRKAPPNLSKVDYYPATQTLYQVLDARMLDCWRIHYNCKGREELFSHFTQLNESDNLPTFEQLYKDAQLLYNRYGSPQSFYRALSGQYPRPDVKVGEGSIWTSPSVESSSAAISQPSTGASSKKAKGKKKADGPPEPKKEFLGDQALAQSCRLMYDASISREMVLATSSGAVGRMWEVMKAMLFTFAGSSHTKYTNYLLEMVCEFELESTPEERELLLTNWLVNPSGGGGRFIAGDQYQEQLQDELYEKIGRKDAGFDDNYLRNVISPNIHRFLASKKMNNEALGLEKRSWKHKEPHTKWELSELMKKYSTEELHLFRKGRRYGDNVERVDDLGRGVDKLRGSKLESFVTETSRSRNVSLGKSMESLQAEFEQASEEIMEEIASGKDTADLPTPGTLFATENGELITLTESDLANVPDVEVEEGLVQEEVWTGDTLINDGE